MAHIVDIVDVLLPEAAGERGVFPARAPPSPPPVQAEVKAPEKHKSGS